MTAPVVEDVRYHSRDGIKLYARDHGRGVSDALPLVCLSSLTGNHREFDQLANFFATHRKRPRRVVAFDYRGRGNSARDRDWRNYAILTEAQDVLDGMAALGIEHAAMVGSSRGGLIVMALAALRPGAMRAVVLNDVGPVLDGAGLAQIRGMVERMPIPADWREAVEILRSTRGKAFAAYGDADWEVQARIFFRDKNGKPEPDHDPALLKQLAGIDFDKPLPTLWSQFDGLSRIPLLAIRAENSTLLSAETLALMEQRSHRITCITVPGQGHAPALHTAGLPEAIDEFLSKAAKRRR